MNKLIYSLVSFIVILGGLQLTTPALAQTGQQAMTAFNDVTVPSIPTNLVATPFSSSRIDLSWSASTDNIGVVGY